MHITLADIRSSINKSERISRYSEWISMPHCFDHMPEKQGAAQRLSTVSTLYLLS